MKIAFLPSKRPYSKDKSIKSKGKWFNLFNRIQNTAKQKDVMWLKAIVHTACLHYDNLVNLIGIGTFRYTSNASIN